MENKTETRLPHFEGTVCVYGITYHYEMQVADRKNKDGIMGGSDSDD